MNRKALIRSLKNARLELCEVENSPMLHGFTGRRLEIIKFIHRIKKELAHDNTSL